MFYAIYLVTHVAQYDPNWLHVMSFRLLESLTWGYAVVKFMEKKWRELLKCCFCDPFFIILHLAFCTSSLFSSTSSSSSSSLSPSLCSCILTTKTLIHIFYILFQEEPRRPTSSAYCQCCCDQTLLPLQV